MPWSFQTKWTWMESQKQVLINVKNILWNKGHQTSIGTADQGLIKMTDIIRDQNV